MKAHAVVAEVVIFTYAAVAVVAAILYAMGISKGQSPSDFESLRDAVVLHLQNIGMVSSSGKITLYGFGGGVVTVASALIAAVRSYLFDNNVITSDQSISPIPSIDTHSFNMTPDSSYYLSPSIVYAISMSSDYSSAFQNVFQHFNLNLSDIKYLDVGVVSVSGTLLMQVQYCTLSSVTVYYSSSFHYWYTGMVGNTTVVSAIVHDDDSSTPVVNYRDDYTSSYGDIFDRGTDYHLFHVSSICHHSTNILVTGDLNADGAISDGIDDSTNIDVIYPGWYEHADSVDTNIEQDLDNDGAIDNIIPADQYYPLTIPFDATDVYDWTQEKAQAGTGVDAMEGTQDSTETADAAKVGSDSYVINGAPSYTFQVRDFFPFCIPFDVYDMCSCLAADPVAPSFDWVFPVLGHDYEISIDLSVFNSVAAIVRTMETLAFAVGLAMATKKMIQGGD